MRCGIARLETQEPLVRRFWMSIDVREEAQPILHRPILHRPILHRPILHRPIVKASGPFAMPNGPRLALQVQGVALSSGVAGVIHYGTRELVRP